MILWLCIVQYQAFKAKTDSYRQKKIDLYECNHLVNDLVVRPDRTFRIYDRNADIIQNQNQIAIEVFPQ